MASEQSNVSQWWTGGNPDPQHINPLNNGLGSGGGAGLGTYPDLPTAALYVVETLSESPYTQVVSDLNSSAAPSVTAQAIWSSPWSSGHYADPNTPSIWGSAWHSGNVATVAAPSDLW